MDIKQKERTRILIEPGKKWKRTKMFSAMQTKLQDTKGKAGNKKH